MLTDVLNVLSTNAAHDIKLPAMQTARQPYLLASADTTGPGNRIEIETTTNHSELFRKLTKNITYCVLSNH